MKKKYWFLIMAVLAASVVWNVYWNGNIVVHTYDYDGKDVPEDFKGYRIVQLTDIHSVRSDRQGELILQKTTEQEPDVICITGDLIDSRYYADNGIEGEQRTLALLEALLELAPVFYIYGNHEMILLDDPVNNSFKVAVEEMGVQIINNEVIQCQRTKGGDTIYIAGIQDPSTLYKDIRYAYLENNAERMEAMMERVTVNRSNEEFVLLLSHRPEYLDLYDQYPVDLVLTGHAHGGQFRVPFIGGVYAPGQGFLPKYTAGLYRTSDTYMYVGTGIGNSVIPVRIFNPPEILTIVLE